MKKSHRETQRQPEPLQDAGAGRGTQRGHGTLPTTELASELSPTRPGTALPGPVGTRAGLTPRPPAPTTPARPEKGQHEPACSIPAPCSVRGGPRGWWGGPSAPLLLGRWVMLPSSPGVLLTGVTPAAERGLPAPVQGHAPPSPRPVTRSSSCLPAACQLRMAPAVTPGRCLRCLHSWRSHGDSCWVLAAGGGSGRGDRVPEPCAPPPPPPSMDTHCTRPGPSTRTAQPRGRRGSGDRPTGRSAVSPPHWSEMLWSICGASG